jgi:ubiquinol-cytochrome c reductase cytochrome b subunit
MRILKSHPLLKMVNSYVIDSPQPSNISYLWNFGSLLAVCLIIQIVTGVTLGMHYTPTVLEAFDSVEHIMRDVNNGWLIRYLHSNTASAFFFIVYLHIGRGLYYGSYKAPRTLVWTLGTIIFLLMMATGFLGYVLPYGQMSLWGATVITNLMSAIPWIGQDIVEFIWGGFSVNNATLNRFFALHFVLPFVLAALALMHLIALHDSAGSGNPLGVSGNYDRLPMAPYFLFKDLITIFLFIVILSIFVFFMPNVLGDSENYVMANPMQTPPAIVPEWYLLPFYAILRSIPNKLLGVIAMFAAILALLAMPFSDLSKLRGIQFRPLSKIAFYVFVANFLILMQLGAKHVESPFIEFGQISTVLYFSHFLIIVPFITLLENSLMDLATNTKNVFNSNNPNVLLAVQSFPTGIIIILFCSYSVILDNFNFFVGELISSFHFVSSKLIHGLSYLVLILDNKPQPELVIHYTILGLAFGVASFLVYKWRKNKKIRLYAKLPVDSQGLTISKFSVPIPKKIIFAHYVYGSYDLHIHTRSTILFLNYSSFKLFTMPISLPHLRTSVDLDINYYNYLDREYNNMIINSQQQTLLFYYFTQIYLSILLPNKK